MDRYGAAFDRGYGSQSGDEYGGGYGSREDYSGGREFGGGGFGGGGGDRGWGGQDSGRGSRSGYFEGGMEDVGGRGRRGSESEGLNMRAAEIMTDDPETVMPDTTLTEVAQKMRDLDVGILPVVESDQNRRLRGVVTDRDITIRGTAEGKDAQNTKVSEVMSTDIQTVNQNDRVREVLNVMRREQVKRVPVTDREGRLVGIIAEADLLSEMDDDEAVTLEQTFQDVYRGGRSQGSGRRESQRGGQESESRGGGMRAGPQGAPRGSNEE
jgi:CBS domain-containing protein